MDGHRTRADDQRRHGVSITIRPINRTMIVSGTLLAALLADGIGYPTALDRDHNSCCCRIGAAVAEHP